MAGGTCIFRIITEVRERVAQLASREDAARCDRRPRHPFRGMFHGGSNLAMLAQRAAGPFLSLIRAKTLYSERVESRYLHVQVAGEGTEVGALGTGRSLIERPCDIFGSVPPEPPSRSQVIVSSRFPYSL